MMIGRGATSLRTMIAGTGMITTEEIGVISID
jgi:hypothetical protein